MEENSRINILLALLSEESAQLRFRSQAEHLYTAACLGAYGAFAWGVAALRNEDFFERPWWMRPAFIAAFAILASATLVIIRIFAEHGAYKVEQRNQAQLVDAIFKIDGMSLPVQDRLRQRAAGKGAHASAALVLAAA